MIAVIMAGGKGTRLKDIAVDIPKPMVPVCNKPVLEHQIINLKKSGITDIILIIGHLGERIKEYFKDGRKLDVNISYVIEETPLGTAGALYYIKDKIKEDFFLIFGDLMLDVDWKRMKCFHKEKGAAITLLSHPNSHPFDSDLIIADKNNKVINWDSKHNIRDYYYKNLVNSGIYIISPIALKYIIEPKKMDFEKHIVIPAINELGVYSYRSTEYVKDMGTLERYEAVSSDYSKGVIKRKNLKNPQKCIFLDRDGTLNELDGFINNNNKIKLIEGVADAIKLINASEYLCIIITNQPVIARGECSFEELQVIHNKIETILGKAGAYVDDIIFCPHHPHSGYKGEVKELKVNCNCRKPNIGMITDAVDRYNINLEESWFIGDTTVDIQTGINAGTKTILLLTGEKGQDGKYSVVPDTIKLNLLDAVKHIMEV
ncbi:D,D-heptose 1,7-bisphosphate phosphatase [Clostridium amylolyticum]|uniref:D,D-heptose 1,7-bisphosphate phosphatase n=1 Tax=Clostridium amylolyticum TaxID=1121298 RepID=A0A1M6M7X6_9CLOT|nr:HAD-IIIA family hydrolase [Clostridium amylolyticum]SHJ79571.1 D,D-heptose 1,7-bisphosphate phosphatase [Clostridium amylolyticum]